MVIPRGVLIARFDYVQLAGLWNSLRGLFTRIAGWIDRSRSGPEEESKKFIDLAPTDKADEAGVYSDALRFATENPRVSNIALTGPYGSGKSSIIKSFLKNYRRPFLQISLAAFLPEATGTGRDVSRQEIERSILQQMLYGADANRLPLSRFKRIQSPGKWSIFTSLYIILGLFAVWNLIQNRDAIIKGGYFLPFATSNWFNLTCFVVGGTFLWLVLHHFYVASFGVSLKSISLKDIEITPTAASQESILNRHLDEIIYFFQSTKYDLVVIEDLDRFNNAEIFVTLREINSLVNANSGVKRRIRFLYALRDDIFVTTDRTKFFEFIVPVIPIINSSNSIDKVLEQGKRLALDSRLDRQFLREVSRYLDDLRLIQNIFNEYAIYVANLETDGENVLDTNKLLAVLIYKNVFPSDFENLHRGKGNLAQILDRHDELIAKGEAELKAEISRLDEQIDIGARQLPADLGELRKIYAMALIEKLPASVTHVGLNGQSLIALPSLSTHESFEQIIQAPQLSYQFMQGHQQRLDVSGFQAEVDPLKTYQQRREEIERKTVEFKSVASKSIRDFRAKLSALRMVKFNEIIRQNAVGMEDLFKGFGDNAELARFLIFEGFLDDTYYQYTSLFHSGRLSPNDNKYLIQIRAFANPDPDFQIDNPAEVIAAMRDEDFRQSYVLNVKIVDCLLSDRPEYTSQTAKLLEFMASDFAKCEAFFAAYYARGTSVSALVSALVKTWAGFVPAAMSSSTNLPHIARIIAHLPMTDIADLPKKHPDISEFVSENLSEILALGIDFDPGRLKLLEIEAVDLPSIGSYPGVARLLFEESLYRLSIVNVDFIFRDILGNEDLEHLHKQHYTSVIEAGNAVLLAKIDRHFPAYLENVLLSLGGNTEEGVPAILSILKRDELEIESLKAFLARQSALVPALDQAPAGLHAVLFEIEKIEVSWDNCLAFLPSESFDADILTAYLNKKNVVAALSRLPIPDGDQALQLRKFLIENDALDDDAYATYVRALPKPFQKFPEDLGLDKLRILIEEKKVSFSSANLAFLSKDGDIQLLFVAENIDRYLEIESECAPDDAFREKLLDCDIRDEQKLRIIKAMDLAALAGMPSRAAKVGPILVRTGAEVGEVSADSAVAIVINSRPINVQIPLLNKFQRNLDDQQIRTLLGSLPAPFSDIKPGYGTPRIESTDANLEFVRWLEERRFISSWGQGGLLGLDNDIRINLRRK